MNVNSKPMRSIALLMTATMLALSACEDGSNFAPLASLRQSDPQGESIDIVERDVEKPEIFSQRDMALWDGRPSFGGVWVALPGNVQPERVSVTNVDNGKSVLGALFKREEQNPGPPIRLSSDAAAALDVVPGQPTLVAVTVVRRETFANVPNTPADPLPAEVETAALAPVDGAAAPPDDAGALAESIAASLDEEPTPTDTEDQDTNAEAVAVAASAAATTATAAAPQAEPPRQRRSLMDLFRNRRDDPPRASGGEVITVLAPEPDAPIAETAPVAIEATTLPASSADPAPEPAPRPATGLAKPFLQTGTFSTRENAESQVARLDAAGVPALIRSRTTDTGKTLYRVVAGPAVSESQQDDFAQAVRGIGIKDAFATAN